MKTILVLAANPVDTNPLRLGVEIREITDGLRRAQKGSQFSIQSVHAPRTEDVRRAMLDYKPSIVHFSGHGSEDGIYFEDQVGEANLVSTEALSGFFKIFAEHIDCVVLNACYSKAQAEAIAKHINHVVGMHGSVDDRKAILFSVAFYDALGAGQNVEFAYDLALNATQWEHGGESLKPVLINRDAKPCAELDLIQSTTERLKRDLRGALSAYKGQPEVFIEPTLTKDRDVDGDDNILLELIEKPHSTLVLAQPQFGQTCLCRYMLLEAYKKGAVWAYVDAKHTNTRKMLASIQEQCESSGKSIQKPDCILVDSWDGNIIEHINMINCLDVHFLETPIMVMINYTEPTFVGSFNFSKLKHSFQVTHLQPLRRLRVRELVKKYGEAKCLQSDDGVVTKVVSNLAALNVHRTPLNCLTLLRVFEKNWSEEIINRTRLIKSVLFILFTDSESFTYATSKPDVDDCEYILGRFCKSLLERGVTTFQRRDLVLTLQGYCKEKLISVDVGTLINILESNTILICFGEELEFKHSYWIYYFAATYMLHDTEFATKILRDRHYVNYPEIIEFYTGSDGRRLDAVKTLISDTESLVATVDGKIGIPEDFNPYEKIVWNPSNEAVEAMRSEMSRKVEESNLPTEIKDRYADRDYDASAPYDQSIRQFLKEFSVISLMQAIKAASRALRNSKYVDPDLKREMLECIVKGWASMARVIFVLAPNLAQRGHAAYDGFGLILSEDFEGSYHTKFKEILIAGPFNIVRYLKDDLSSGKIGPLIHSLLKSQISNLQKHFLAHFLIRERPEGWFTAVYEYMNLLHRNSFYLWDLSNAVDAEIALGFISTDEAHHLKQLTEIVIAKHVEGPRRKDSNSILLTGQAVSEENKLPIDKIRAAAKRRSGFQPK